MKPEVVIQKPLYLLPTFTVDAFTLGPQCCAVENENMLRYVDDAKPFCWRFSGGTGTLRLKGPDRIYWEVCGSVTVPGHNTSSSPLVCEVGIACEHELKFADRHIPVRFINQRGSTVMAVINPGRAGKARPQNSNQPDQPSSAIEPDREYTFSLGFFLDSPQSKLYIFNKSKTMYVNRVDLSRGPLVPFFNVINESLCGREVRVEFRSGDDVELPVDRMHVLSEISRGRFEQKYSWTSASE